MKRNEDSLKDLWDNIKCTNICSIGVPEGEEKQKGPEKMSEEVIAKNFPNNGKGTVTQVQEAQRIIHHDQVVWCMILCARILESRMQGFFNTCKSISVIHHIKKLKNKNYMIISINEKKFLTKFNIDLR